VPKHRTKHRKIQFTAEKLLDFTGVLYLFLSRIRMLGSS